MAVDSIELSQALAELEDRYELPPGVLLWEKSVVNRYEEDFPKNFPKQENE